MESLSVLSLAGPLWPFYEALVTETAAGTKVLQLYDAELCTSELQSYTSPDSKFQTVRGVKQIVILPTAVL